MSEKTIDKGIFFERDLKDALVQLVAPMAGYGVTMTPFFRPTVTKQYSREPVCVTPRFHGRHQFNRYDDGSEKCVGYELYTWTCPADAIFTKTTSNTPEEQYSAGERCGRIRQVNRLCCIFCGMCIGACPTRAPTTTNDFEIARYTREDNIYEKEDLLVPLSDGMFAAPYPMTESKNDIDYYRGEITDPAIAQVDWVASRCPDDPFPKTM